MKKYLFAITILPLLLVLFSVSASAQITTSSPTPDIDQPTVAAKADSTKLAPVEQIPEFPGGFEKFMAYIKSNFKTPRNNGAEGRIIITFVIEKDGSVTNVKIARGLSERLDKEAVRVLSESPKWRPGMQNGKPVRVAYSVPIQIPFN